MLVFENINKSYGGRELLRDASFAINKGEHVGIVGPNGAGKSTIFGMISGEIEPDRGTIRQPADLRLGYLRQHLDNREQQRKLVEFVADADPEAKRIEAAIATIEDQLADETPTDSQRLLAELGRLRSQFEAMGGYRLRDEAARALGGLGFPSASFDRPLQTFSGGWQMRASLARALVAEPDLLMLDEPSNYLDVPAVEWLEKRLRSFAGTLLLISHDRHLLRSLTTIIIEVNAGEITRYPGAFDVYIAQRAERRRITEAAKKNQDRKIDQMERFVERFRAKNTKAALAKSQMRKIERIERIEITREWEKRGRIVLPPPPKCGAESVRIEQVAFSYDGRANIFENVDFSLMRGEKAALVGYNGTGKTTLLKVMAGVLQPTSGRRALGHQVVVGYQAQEFSDILLPNESVYHVVKSAASPDFPLKDLRNLLGSFGFTGDDVHKSCSVLSGGEKIRLLFARIFVSPPNLLILDEPTTHLDLEAREALQESVRTFEGTVCLVSHDIEFIRATAGTIIEMKPPGIRKFFGDYDYYREKLRRDEDATTTRTETASRSDEVAAPGSEAGKDRRRQRAQARQDMSTKRKALEQSVRKRESEIEELEQEQSQLIAQIENPDNSTDYASINRRLSEIETRLVASNADWDHAVQALDEFMLQYREIHQ